MTTPESVQQAVGDAQRLLDDAKRNLDETVAVAAMFPNATKEGWPPAGWCSPGAHETATHVDPVQIHRAGSRMLTFAVNVLYVEIPTPSGPARVYSTRPVDLLDGFAAHAASGGTKPLIDCLRATTKKAEAALAAHQREQEEGKAKREAEMALKLGADLRATHYHDTSAPQSRRRTLAP
jgi:hypothetical protein